MNQQPPKLDKRYVGATRPHRHRIRRLLTTLTLLFLVVLAAVAVGVTAHAIVRGTTATMRTPSGMTRNELMVSDELAEEPIEESDEQDDEDADVEEDQKADVEEDQEEEEGQKADGKSEKPVEPQEPVEVNLMMIGDVLMHDGVIDSGYQGDGTYNYDHLFAPIAADVQAADIAILNQETILGGDLWPLSGYPVFNSPQSVGDAEVAVGFDVILKATNHTLDLGYDGVRAELAYWASAHPEMAVIGMADPDGDGICPAGGTSAGGPYIYEKDGLRIALINYTNVLNGNVDESYDAQVVSIFDADQIAADVAAAREQGADFVVAFPHWGPEYETAASDGERWCAQVFYDAGVDVVIGGHPHVIQQVEVIGEGDHKMLVMWSVGNYVSTMVEAFKMVGGMAKVTFIKDAEGARVGAYEFVPIVCRRVARSPLLTAYKLADLTDEMAAGSDTPSIDGGNGASQAWYIDFCASVLGEAFDYDTLSVHGSMS